MNSVTYSTNEIANCSKKMRTVECRIRKGVGTWFEKNVNLCKVFPIKE